MLADPLGLLACRLRIRVLQLCSVCVDLVGVRANGGRGIAAVELSEEAHGVALVGHVDESLLLAQSASGWIFTLHLTPKGTCSGNAGAVAPKPVGPGRRLA
jgi:hypothetical protein